MTRSTQAPDKSLKLGDLMVREGLLTHDALTKALAAQKQTGHTGQYRPLGQICVDLKLITKQDLQRFLSRHHKRIQIGELLMNMGLITQNQLNHVLEQQRVSGLRFGTLLVKSGIISEIQLTNALSVQLDIPRIVPSPELIDPELIKDVEEDFLRQHIFLPMHRHGNQMVVVMSDPLNSDLLQLLIDRFKCKIMPAIAPASEILSSLTELYKPKRRQRQTDESLDDDLLNLSNQAKHTKEQVMPIANFLVRTAVESGATALHLESQERYLRLRLRIDGVLRHRTDLPSRLGPPLIECIKTPFRIKRENYWEEHITTTIGKQKVELSISFFQGVWGENLVVHIAYVPPRLLGVENLGFSPYHQRRVNRMLNGAGGILLAATPLRSGKSTLLYAGLTYLNHLSRSILALEDIVDYPIPGVIQNHYTPVSKDSYASLIEAMIDYDSDVIMVGELKDKEVCERVSQAALTGKKALAALNACDTTAALHRLINQGSTNFLTAPVPMMIVSQRLVRKLCETCKTSYTPDLEDLRDLHVLPSDRGNYTFWQPHGCGECDHQGYRGLTAIHEILEINESLREAIRRGVTASGIRELARGEGRLISLAEDGVYKVIQGVTSIEEVQRVAIAHEGDALSARSLREVMSTCQGKQGE